MPPGRPRGEMESLPLNIERRMPDVPCDESAGWTEVLTDPSADSRHARGASGRESIGRTATGRDPRTDIARPENLGPQG
jgi:hypothetical protein